MEDWGFSIPSATVPATINLELLRRPGIDLRLKVTWQRTSSQTANIIRKRSGTRGERIDVRAYLSKRCDLDRILALINIDGAGQFIGSDSIILMSGSAALEAHLRQLIERWPENTWVEPWYESDQPIFAFRGVPSIPISSTGFADPHHRPDDTPEWIDANRLERIVSLVYRMVVDLQGKTRDCSGLSGA